MHADADDIRIAFEQFDRSCRTFFPPAPVGDVELLERALGRALPDNLRSLYQLANGGTMPRETFCPLRMMTVAESAELHEDLSKGSYPCWDIFQMFYIWTDDESNYVGVFLDGPFRGMIAFLDHEEFNPAPRFWNLARFMLALADDRHPYFFGPEIDADFPMALRSPANDEAEASRALANAAIHAARTCSDHEQAMLWQRCAIDLWPASNVQMICNALDVDDMWVPAHAATVLGEMRHASAIPQLERLAGANHTNSSVAAIEALGKVASPSAGQALLRVAPTISRDRACQMAAALLECGLEVRRTDLGHEYRPSPHSPWLGLG